MISKQELVSRIDEIMTWLNTSPEGREMIAKACNRFITNVQQCGEKSGGHFGH